MKYFFTMLSIAVLLPNWGRTQTLYIPSGATVYTNSTGSSPTLSVTGAIQNNGTLTLEGGISGSSDMTLSGTLNIPIGSPIIGSGYDQILLTGNVTLSSCTLNVTLSNGYSPTSGTSFTILDAATLSGVFLTINLPTLSSGLSWTTSYNGSAGTVILTVTSSVLPVELLTFTARPISDNQVQLDWSTALEQNTAFFTLERSRNGQDFTPLSTTKAKGSKSDYSQIDAAPFSGVNYYRLKINGLDGKVAYSKAVSAIIGSSTFKIRIYPSIVVDVVNVSTDGGDVTAIDIFNTAGQVVLSKNKGMLNGSLARVDLSALAAGMYVVRARNTEGVVTTAKIMKQH